MKRPNFTAFLFVTVILAIQCLMGLIVALIMDRSILRIDLFTAAANPLIPALLLGAGMALVVSYHGMDFSVGGVLSLSAVLTALVTRQSGSFMMGAVAGTGCALLAGALNGAVTAWLRMPGYVTTLATWGMSAHMAFLLAGNRSISLGDAARIPMLGGLGFFGSILLAVILLLPVLFFAFGRSIAFTGSVSTAGTFCAYVLSGWCAGAAAVVLVGQGSGAIHALGEGRQWLAIAAAILGGSFLFRGSRASLLAIATTVLAVLTLAWLKELSEGLNLSRDQVVGVRFLPAILCGLVYALAARVLFQPPSPGRDS